MVTGEQQATTVELHDLYGRIEQSLSADAVRLVGECRNSSVHRTFLAFDLCSLRGGHPHVVRVTLDRETIGKVRRHVETRAGLALEDCLTDGREVAVVGSIRINRASVELSARQVFIDDMSSVGSVQTAVDARPAELRARGIPPDRLVGTTRQEKLTPKRPLAHITVVTGAASQGFGDFERALQRAVGRGNTWPAVHRLRCAMQGPDTAARLVETLRGIDPASTDAVCIIRGGGSWFDLWPFNSLDLAEVVHDLPVPVYTAIGHSDDRFSLDCAADGACDTPGALGAALGWAARPLPSGRPPLNQRGGPQRKTHVPAALPDTEMLRRRLNAEEQARHRAESRLRTALTDLRREQDRSGALRRESLEEGIRLGERSARHEVIGIALVVTILVTLAIGGLAIAVDELVFAVVALFGAAGSGRLILGWARTAPERPMSPGRQFPHSKLE